MRKYILASPTEREKIKLTGYESVIEKAVHTFMPDATVHVEDDCYYVDPSPSKGDAIKIGRMICQSDLKHCCVQIPKLFCSMNIDMIGDGNDAKKEAKHVGGHS